LTIGDLNDANERPAAPESRPIVELAAFIHAKQQA
jgi:hypothetical protein